MSPYQEVAIAVRPFDLGRVDTPARPALRHRLPTAAAVGRSVTRFFAAGQLAGTASYDLGRWTGARC